jgi:hypothetical protein
MLLAAAQFIASPNLVTMLRYETQNSREIPVLTLSKDVREVMKGMKYVAKQVACAQECTLYWGQTNGFVSFYAHIPDDESGYGGRVVDLTMMDGSVRKVKGPWSSRPDIMNEEGFPPCVDCIVLCPMGTSGQMVRFSANLLCAYLDELRAEFRYV